jgi:16S rRNA (cytidine1402-2'-O)-methyltransferase
LSSAAKTTSGTGSRAVEEPSARSGASKPDRRGRREAAADALLPGLYLVATPIGNLADITLRALSVLKGADRICCEDTRVTGRLLSHYGIKKPLQPYHDHNAERARPEILAALRGGERVALVSDAGTPLVSDPGYKLVRAAIAEGLPVSAVPGPSAALVALLVSGLPPDRFLFAGFLPPRQSARRRALGEWAALKATLIFFERASRLAETLADMAAILGDRPVAVSRELTKLYEEVRRGRLAELAALYRQEGPPRGEAAIVIAPAEAAVPAADALDARLEAALGERPLREAAARLAAETGLPRSTLYRRALAFKRVQAKRR